MFVNKCGAKARTNGYQPCRQPAMANGRCRFHGGKSPVKHGYYTKQAIKERKQLRQLFKQMKEF